MSMSSRPPPPRGPPAALQGQSVKVVPRAALPAKLLARGLRGSGSSSAASLTALSPTTAVTGTTTSSPSSSAVRVPPPPPSPTRTANAAEHAAPPPPPPLSPPPSAVQGSLSLSSTLSTDFPYASTAAAPSASLSLSLSLSPPPTPTPPPPPLAVVPPQQTLSHSHSHSLSPPPAAADALARIRRASIALSPATQAPLSRDREKEREREREKEKEREKEREADRVPFRAPQTTDFPSPHTTHHTTLSHNSLYPPSPAPLSSQPAHTTPVHPTHTYTPPPPTAVESDALSLSALSFSTYADRHDETLTASNATAPGAGKSWSSLASALSEIALSNKLREHLTELKDEVLAQAQRVAESIQRVHDTQTQRCIRDALRCVGDDCEREREREGENSERESEKVKETESEGESKTRLSWDDVREILSLRTLSLQQRELLDVAKRERALLAEQIDVSLSRPRRVSLSRSAASQHDALTQHCVGEEQLLLHRISFFDEKLHEFVYRARERLAEEQALVKERYAAWAARRDAVEQSACQVRERYAAAMRALRVDREAHDALACSLLERVLSRGESEMREIERHFQTNPETVRRRESALDAADAQLAQCYARVAQRVDREREETLSRPEARLQSLSRWQRAVFAWKTHHAQALQDRASMAESVLDNYHLSLAEDLSQDVLALQRLALRLQDYDSSLTHYLNALYGKENQSRTRRLVDLDLDALLRWQSFTTPVHTRRNVLRLGTRIQSAAVLAGLSANETIDVLQELLSVHQRKAMYS